ncbi:MAG: orotidine 5'-phosphate decarboxylase / HUMPS family protein [archaeon]|nr:orotidine 5'-phosphate decarboxylase / HUMPS family protein [archaeon]
MNPIISQDRSIIPACDVSLEVYLKIVKETGDIDAVSAYKIGFELGLLYGLPDIVAIAREHGNKKIIYDHQKAGTDIPDTGKSFMKVMKQAGVDAVILFPQAGPKTQKAWINAAQDLDLGVIVGGLMTHPQYIRSEGGYISDEAIMEIYLNAVDEGVTNFVVPGNKVNDLTALMEELERVVVDPVLYSPGLVTQGGDISDAGRAAGEKWHAIVGRGIYQAEDMKQAVMDLSKNL